MAAEALGIKLASGAECKWSSALCLGLNWTLCESVLRLRTKFLTQSFTPAFDSVRLLSFSYSFMIAQLFGPLVRPYILASEYAWCKHLGVLVVIDLGTRQSSYIWSLFMSLPSSRTRSLLLHPNKNSIFCSTIAIKERYSFLICSISHHRATSQAAHLLLCHVRTEVLLQICSLCRCSRHICSLIRSISRVSPL